LPQASILKSAIKTTQIDEMKTKACTIENLSHQRFRGRAGNWNEMGGVGTAEKFRGMKRPTPSCGSLRQSKLDRTKVTALPFATHGKAGTW